jgi:negative regulator of sigma E activity
MATNDELLQERQEMWHNVTRFTTAAVVLVAVVLLLMLIFLT